jgi:hypothetical protein
MPVIPVAEPSRRISDLQRTAAGTPRPSPGAVLAGQPARRSSQPLSRAELSAFVRCVFAALDRHWRRDPAADAGLRLLVSAAGTADLPTGIYSAEAGHTVRFTPLGSQCLTPAPPHQSLASFLVAADLRRVTGPAGIGYPAMLVQTGVLAQFLSLAAAAGGRTSLVDTASSYETAAGIRKLDRGLRHMLTVTVQGGGEDDDDRR